MEIRGKTFRGEAVSVEDHQFVDCEFIDCEMLIDGGEAHFSRCNFINPKFVPAGALFNGLDMLRSLAHRAGPKAVKQLADSLAAIARKPDQKRDAVIDL